MTQYNSLNVKLSNSQLNKLKSAIKNKTEIVLRLSSNMIGDDATNFLHKLLLTNRQVGNLRKAFAEKSSTDINLSETRISKMIQSGGFNVIKPSVLIPLGLTAAASAADTGIYKKTLESGRLPLCDALHNMKY